MKILVFSDSHGSKSIMRKLKEKSKKVDLVLCCGDFTIFEQNLNNIIKEMDSWEKPILIIPGNHEYEDSVEKACSKSKNLIYVNESYYATDDLIVVGIEGNGFTIEDKKFKKTAKRLKRILAKHEDKKYILMTHAPPYKTKLDLLYEGHCGNKSVRDFIIDSKPIYAFSGHLHENSGKRDILGKTKVLNVGPIGKIINI